MQIEQKQTNKPTAMEDWICANKVCFNKEAYAQTELSRIQKRKWRGRGKKPVRCYKCPICNGWHVTSKAIWEDKVDD